MSQRIIYIPRKVAQEGVAYLKMHGFDVKEGTGIDEDTMCKEVRGWLWDFGSHSQNYSQSNASGTRAENYC